MFAHVCVPLSKSSPGRRGSPVTTLKKQSYYSAINPDDIDTLGNLQMKIYGEK